MVRVGDWFRKGKSKKPKETAASSDANSHQAGDTEKKQPIASEETLEQPSVLPDTPSADQAVDAPQEASVEQPPIDPMDIFNAAMPSGIMRVTMLNGVAADGQAYYAYIAFDEELEQEVFAWLQEKEEIHPFAMLVEQGPGYPSQDVQSRMEEMYDYITPEQVA